MVVDAGTVTKDKNRKLIAKRRDLPDVWKGNK